MAGLTFGRSDSAVLRVLLWIGATVSAVFAVFVPVRDAVNGQSITVRSWMGVSASELAGTTGVAIDNPADVVLVVDEPSAGDRLLNLAPGLVAACTVILAVIMLDRVLRDLGRGEPFAVGNVTRLRATAMAIIAGSAAEAALDAITGMVISGNHLPPGLPPRASFEVPLAWIAGGLVVAAIAEAFARGTELRRDVDGLV